MGKSTRTPAHPAAGTPNDGIAKAEVALRERMAALRADIARELRKYDDERYGLIATNVADSAEQSITDLIGDLYLAEIERDVAELREVESALERIRTKAYGNCVDCGQRIDSARLKLHPEVPRCVRCQKNVEHSRAHGSHSTTL
jgi:RNA polymerase-binding transcription factor DksA